MDELSQDRLRALYRAAGGARWQDVVKRIVPIFLIIVVPILLIMIIGVIAESAPVHQLLPSALIVIAGAAALCIPIAALAMLVAGRFGRARVLAEGRIADKQTYQVAGRYTPSTRYALTLEGARYRKVNHDGTLSEHRALKRIDVSARDFERIAHGQRIRALCWSNDELIQLID
jgi:hypothetical protein